MRKAGKSQEGVGGRHHVIVRDRNGRERAWRSRLPWNQAQRSARHAREAGYAGVRISDKYPHEER